MPKDTVADWNNNPGNLRPKKGVVYEGQIGVDDRGFAIFENKDFGKKALVQDVKAKLDNGLNTPEAFINRYAPAGDNAQDAQDNYKIHLAESLGLKSTTDAFPENSHEKIADAISAFENGSTKNSAENEEESASPPNGSNPTATPGAPPPPSTSDMGGEAEMSPKQLAMIGGGTGLVIGAPAVLAPKAVGLAKDFGRYILNRGGVPASTVARIEPVLAAMAGEAPAAGAGPGVAEGPSPQSTRILQGGEGDTQGTTGRARQTGYNIQTAQEAAAKKEMDAAVELARRAGVTENTAGKFLAQQPGLTATQTGVLYPRTPARPTIGPRTYEPAPLRVQAAQSGTPTIGSGEVPVVGGANPVPQPAPASPLPVSAPEQAGESVLGKMGRYAGKTANALKPVANIALSGLSGVLSAEQLYEAEKMRRMYGWSPETIMKYMSGTGGAISMIPTVPTRILGGALQLPELISAPGNYDSYADPTNAGLY